MIRLRKQNVVVGPSLPASQVVGPDEREIIDEIAEAFAEIDVETRRRTPPFESGPPPRPESDEDEETPARMGKLPLRR